MSRTNPEKRLVKMPAATRDAERPVRVCGRSALPGGFARLDVRCRERAILVTALHE